MSSYHIKINTDNDAFAKASGTEIARILRELADNVDGRDVLPGQPRTLRDVNGNTVGVAEIQEEASV